MLSFAPRIQADPGLAQSFWGAALLLLVWQVLLGLRLATSGETRALDTVLRRQHYLQALVQISVFAYWGWYWRPVYDHAWLLVAQLVFAYAFDMLLAWSRRERYVLGFGPFPIIFSTQPVPLVPRRSVLSAVPDDRGGLPRQGVCAVGA